MGGFALVTPWLPIPLCQLGCPYAREMMPRRHPHHPPAPGSRPRKPADVGVCDPPDPSPCLSPAPL